MFSFQIIRIHVYSIEESLLRLCHFLQQRDDLMTSETVNAYLSERSDDAKDDFS